MQNRDELTTHPIFLPNFRDGSAAEPKPVPALNLYLSLPILSHHPDTLLFSGMSLLMPRRAHLSVPYAMVCIAFLSMRKVYFWQSKYTILPMYNVRMKILVFF